VVDHHLDLRRLIHEWIERQEQLLSRRTMGATDGRFSSSGQASSDTLTYLVDDGGFEPSNDGVEVERQPAHQVTGHAIFRVPEGPDDMAKQPEQNGCDRGTPNDPLSQQMQATGWVAPVGAEDMPEESQQHECSGDKPSKMCKTSTFMLHNQKLAEAEPTLAKRVVQRLALQRSASANNFLEDLSDMVNNRFRCPLINSLEESRGFNCVTGLVILLNAISMAVAADYEMQNFQAPTSETFIYIELGFVIAYTIELVIRIIARRLAFFCLPWSWFDIVIVAVGWLEVISSSATSLSQVRLMRILKMMKAMRVLRVMRSLREVRLLLNSLMGSVKPLLWTVVIITGINFMFGIAFVQSIAAFRHDNWTNGAANADGQPESEQVEASYRSWASVPQAMYTLFKVSTGGVSWGEVSDPLLLFGWQTFSIFLLYIALFMFVMANAVTAIFVSSVEEYASKDAQNLIYDQFAAKQDYMNQIRTLFDEMDDDNSGKVERTEFVKFMEDERMIEFATKLDIEIVDVDRCFDVLSARGKEPVDLDSFVDGCIRLRGTARSIDVLDMLIHQKQLTHEVSIIHSLLEERQTLGLQT